MQSFDIESLIGTGKESHGFSGISEKARPETETVKEAIATKAITINEFSAEISTSPNSNFDLNLIKSEFSCGSEQSRLHPGTSSVVSSTRTINPESKYLATAFHTYPCISGSKSQSQCASSSPSVSG